MPVIPLVPSDSPTLISSLLRLSAHHLALAALASQPLKSGALSLYLFVPVPVLTPSVIISRPTTASRPSTPLNPSPLAPQIRLCWPLCAFINYIYLLTYSGTWIVDTVLSGFAWSMFSCIHLAVAEEQTASLICCFLIGICGVVC